MTYTFSSRSRYDHFDTSPSINSPPMRELSVAGIFLRRERRLRPLDKHTIFQEKIQAQFSFFLETLLTSQLVHDRIIKLF